MQSETPPPPPPSLPHPFPSCLLPTLLLSSLPCFPRYSVGRAGLEGGREGGKRWVRRRQEVEGGNLGVRGGETDVEACPEWRCEEPN